MPSALAPVTRFALSVVPADASTRIAGVSKPPTTRLSRATTSVVSASQIPARTRPQGRVDDPWPLPSTQMPMEGPNRSLPVTSAPLPASRIATEPPAALSVRPVARSGELDARALGGIGVHPQHRVVVPVDRQARRAKPRKRPSITRPAPSITPS